MLVKTRLISFFRLKTVGYVLNLDGLVHQWVPEMVLNVQSESYKKQQKLFCFCFKYLHKAYLYVS